MATKFNPAPGWPPTPDGWTPPPGWTPDPSWPPAPEGWEFWIDEATPAASKKNHLVWIIPVAIVAVLALVFGGLAIAGVFSSDDEKPVAVTTTSADPSESVEPTPDPTTPEPTEDPNGFDDPADPDVLEDPLTGGEKSTDPKTPAFCAAYLKVGEKIDTVGDDPDAQELDQIVTELEQLEAPAELADSWEFFIGVTRDAAEVVKRDGGSMDEAADVIPSLAEDEAFAKVMDVVGFVLTNCEES